MNLSYASWHDGTAVFSHAPMDEPLEAGSSVVVAGVDPTTYDGTFVVEACTLTACIVAMVDDPGEYVSGGTIEPA